MNDDRKLYHNRIRRRRNLEALAGVAVWGLSFGTTLFGSGYLVSLFPNTPHFIVPVVILLSLPLGALAGFGAVHLVRLFHRTHWPETPDAE